MGPFGPSRLTVIFPWLVYIGAWFFGAQESNPTHWKNLVRKADQERLRRSFSKAVLERTGFTEREWTDYWHKMVGFRDRYVVHRDKYSEPVPHFNKALQVAYAYDEWIRTKCFPGIWEEPPFERQEQDTRSNIRSYIEHLARNEKRWV